MRILQAIYRARASWLVLVLSLASVCCASGQATITGMVRDGDGKPLPGVHVHITSLSGLDTRTNVSGEYHFTGLAAGEYVVAADLPGYTAKSQITARIGADASAATADLVLIHAVQADAPNAVALPRPKLEFESSGIRGLIDPGGYSASTARAASGLLRGIADVRRTDLGAAAAAAKLWPCALGPTLRQAVASNPRDTEANRRLGQFYTAHDKPTKAIPLLKQVMSNDAHDLAGTRQLALAYLENGDFEGARALLAPIAETPGQPSDPEVHQLLARADEGLGQFQQAALQYRLAAASEPNEENLFGAGYELVLAGSLAPALDAFVAGVARYPRSIALRIGLGTTQFFEGKTREAVDSFLDASDIDPADPRPYPLLAGTLGLANVPSDRISSSLQRLLDRKPDSAAANYYEALALSKSAAPDASRIENLLKRATELDPNLARAHLLLADTLTQRADYGDAVAEYEAAIRLDHSLNDAHYRLALAYKRMGKPDLSAREMQIFRLSTQPNASGSGTIDLGQFVSVMSTANEASSEELHCPAGSQ